MPDPWKDRILKAQLQKLSLLKKTVFFSPPSYFTSFGFILYS